MADGLLRWPAAAAGAATKPPRLSACCCVTPHWLPFPSRLPP